MRRCLIHFFICICPFIGLGQIDSGVVVVEPTLYDAQFIKYWDHLWEVGVLITQDSIIVNNEREEPIIIPTDFPLHQKVSYHALDQDTSYAMVIERLNYTNLSFSIIGKTSDRVFFERRDTAILESAFWLGAEGVYENGDSVYGMNDYNIRNDGRHRLLIPVGTIEVINYYEPLERGRIAIYFKKED